MREEVHINFVIGVQGSGTTMMSRLLGYPANAEVILGNHISIAGGRESMLVKYFRFRRRSGVGGILDDLEWSSATFWSRKASVKSAEKAKASFMKAVDRFKEVPKYAHVQNLIFKRSAPFYVGDSHRPDLLDILDMFPSAKILVMLRDPRASAYSALKRGFVNNIRYSAIICEEQLLLLDARLKAIDEKTCHIVNYKAFCNDPEIHIGKIAELFSMDEAELLKSVKKEGLVKNKNEAWRNKLSKEEVEFLDAYFDNRRMQQFSKLKFDLQLS